MIQKVINIHIEPKIETKINNTNVNGDKNFVAQCIENSNIDYTKTVYPDNKEEFEKLHKRHDKHDENFANIMLDIDGLKDELPHKNWQEIDILIKDFKEETNANLVEITDQIFQYMDNNFADFQKYSEGKYKELYEKLKSSDNPSAKINFALPLLKLLDIAGIPVSGIIEIITKTVDLKFSADKKLKFNGTYLQVCRVYWRLLRKKALL